MMLTEEETVLLAGAMRGKGVLAVPVVMANEPALIRLCALGLLAAAPSGTKADVASFMLTVDGLQLATALRQPEGSCS